MNARLQGLIFIVVLFLFTTVAVQAHVPYFEHIDFTDDRPYVVRNSVEQSIAVYSWIETDFESPATDVDVYSFTLDEPSRVYIESIVPVCPGYEEYHPWFALVGPGLGEPEFTPPFEIPEGYGAVIVEAPDPGEEREIFFEFFGDKSYYQGPVFDEIIDVPGTYYVYYWDPFEYGGDYVAVIGAEEIWGFWDIIRALIYTPLIRRDRELHVECPDPTNQFSGEAALDSVK